MTDTDQQSSPAEPCAAGILHPLLITFLAPMFIMGSGGDIAMARRAATQVVSSYIAVNPLQLFAVVQIVAFGICSLGSLALSMAEELPVSLILRLRGNAVSLSRAGAWHQKVLDTARQDAEFASSTAAWPANNTPVACSPRQRQFQAAAQDVSIRVVGGTDDSCEPGSDGLRGPFTPPPANPDTTASPSPLTETSRVAAPQSQPVAAGRPAASAIATMQPAAAPAAAATARASNFTSATTAPANNCTSATTAPASNCTSATAAPASNCTSVTTAPQPSPAAAAQPAPASSAPGPDTNGARPSFAILGDASDQGSAATDDQLWRSAWADAMAVVADEYASSIPGLPPAQRQEASLKADVLKMTAKELRSSAPTPPGVLNGSGWSVGPDG